MGRFIIHGGKKLRGEISVGGSKNAALPIIFSCILIRGISTLTNVPDIADVDVALDILKSFGTKCTRYGDKVVIDTRELHYDVPENELVSKIRASSYLIGALLGRFGRAAVMRFGGCNFDARPIDMHIAAATALGAKLEGNTLYAERLIGSDIIFDKISVGATVNAILLAVTAKGKSRIFGYAKEPHVISLIEFLRGGGAEIQIRDECICIEGRELYSSSAEIIPDMIEAGSYLALSLMTDSSLRIVGADRYQLNSFLDSLLYGGAVIEYDDVSVSVSGRINEKVCIETAPYPAFPTDLQPIMAPLLAASRGGIIKETVWKGRFGYLDELMKFGIDFISTYGHAEIKASRIKAATAVAPDLRGGAALVLAALYADGESIIDNAELINRGYSDIINKLSAVGADIRSMN